MTAVNHRYPAIQGEFESEDELEFENEFEGELETEDESEFESEFESEGELENEFEGEEEFEFEFEAEAEAEMEAEGELEEEFEAEAEEEAEGFLNPVRRVYQDAELMAHFATQAAHAESESEAEAFIGALVPLAARLIPRAAAILARNGPTLVRGAVRIARRLRRNPQTARLISAFPVVLQRTAQSLADQAANGQPIDATTVVRTLGTMTGRVLSRGAAPRAINAVRVFDRRWQRRNRWAVRRGYPGMAGYGPSSRARRRPGPYGARRPAGRPGMVNRRVRRR
jgi:hypothetical protein